ncbi:MAG: tetratricopeptide repeat protein [Deltaproteobacteria bacterium]|nr:tetratricopeptide repeat protein [Deltaproteobacteria bacterium]MBI3391356.1 tetratricopeptide repeat protein [Deltaproteobacteria bacterium]
MRLVAALTLIAGTTATAAPPSTATDAAAGYVGSTACTPCHAAQAQAWRGSNHKRAMQVADAKTVRGNFHDASLSHSGITSKFFQRDGKFFVRTEGPDGKPATFEIKYTFGVEPLQQYLVEFPGGRLQSLTLAADTRPSASGGPRWFALYPNERIVPGDPLHWTGADQTWNYQCAACHSTNLRKHYDAAANRYATTWSEIDVACEACHGPGARHLAWATAGKDPSVSDYGLSVRLARSSDTRWTIDAQTGNARPASPAHAQATITVCAPCHSRRSVISNEYRPGQPLLDAYLPALLTPGLYYADGQIDGEVYEYGSFVQSRMYRSGVGCTDCHEPHSLKLRAEGNAVCAQCHLAAKYDGPAHHFHPANSSAAKCTSCHMPTRTYMIVDPRHDHSLRVPRPDLSVEIGTPNACTQCHTERSAEWARDRVREWYGHDPVGYQTYARALHAGRTGNPDAAALLSRLVTDTVQPGIARATALGLLRVSPATAGAVETALRDDDALVRRAALASLEAIPPPQRVKLATPLLDDPLRAVRIEAARQLATVPAGDLDESLRARIDRGAAEYVAAQRVDADRPEARTNLGTLFAEQGQGPQAEAEFRAAIALQRSYTPAYVNLADLYRIEQRDPDGERLLRAGIAAAPDDAALQLALGLLLARQKRLPEAIDALQRAATLRPDDPHFGYVLGVALHSSGQTERALVALSTAAARHPTDRELLLALATINRDAGKRDAALEYARRLAAVAPDDPSAKHLVNQLSANADAPVNSQPR